MQLTNFPRSHGPGIQETRQVAQTACQIDRGSNFKLQQSLTLDFYWLYWCPVASELERFYGSGLRRTRVPGPFKAGRACKQA